MLNNYICALDIGSSKIAAAVAAIKRKRINNLFFEDIPSRGLKGGVIVDSIALTGAIERVLKKLKDKSGINIRSVYTNIPGQNVITKHSSAVIPLAERGNKVITLSDINAANEEARILGSSLEEEIIHIIPFNYAIDSRQNVSNPAGLYSHRLEADLYLISGKVSFLENINRAVNHAGCEIKDIFFTGLASSRAVFNEALSRNEEGSGFDVICDIGCDTTEILVYKDARLRNIEILSIGGNDLTSAIADELKLPFDLAEDVKITHGNIGEQGEFAAQKEILIKRNNIYKPIEQKIISGILTANARPICQHIKEAVEKNAAFPEINNFIVIGRAVLLEGFLEMLEHVLGLHVRLGRITSPDYVFLINQNNALAGRKYLTYVTALGIISQALYNQKRRFSSPVKSTHNLFLKITNKLKEVYQEYF